MGQKGFIFSLNQMKGFGLWTSRSTLPKQRSSVGRGTVPVMKQSQILLTVSDNYIKEQIWDFPRRSDPIVLQSPNGRALLITPADGFAEVEGREYNEKIQRREMKQHGLTLESTRQTDSQKQKGGSSPVFSLHSSAWKNIRSLTYTIILSKSLQTIAPAQEREEEIQHRWCQVLPRGDRWSSRTDYWRKDTLKPFRSPRRCTGSWSIWRRKENTCVGAKKLEDLGPH